MRWREPVQKTYCAGGHETGRTHTPPGTCAVGPYRAPNCAQVGPVRQPVQCSGFAQVCTGSE